MTKPSRIIPLVLGLALVAGNALPVFARVNINETRTNAANSERANTPAKSADQDAAKISSLKDKAAREIDRRIKALGALSTRIQTMKKISDAQKTALKSSIQSQITTLTDLKTKIEAENDITALRTDAQSIIKSYRIYALIIPQGTIIAAADRALTLAEQMTTLGTKLQTRISEAKTAGKDVAALEKSLVDYNAKITDAKTQAQAAIDSVSKLTPDNGDKTKMEANLKAMKEAQNKIRAAQQDFVAARKDAKDIAQGLKASGKTDKKTRDTTENAE